MKMIAFSVEKSERPLFERFATELHVELTMVEEKPGLQNAYLTQGMDCINVLSAVVLTKEMWDAYGANGVKAAVTRTIGVEHMNREYAASIGIPVRNISYSPASVADSAIMMMLMSLRNVKAALSRYVGQDYTVSGLRGREMHNMTVGIIGSGPIARTVAAQLQGFGCRIVYWNRTKRPEMDALAEYLPRDVLLGSSDILSLHIASNVETYHFLNRETIAQMKPGAVLVNTARGPLVDSDALIDALESGHLGGAALDVFDGDRYIYYRDHKNKVISQRQRAILNAMPNVLMMQHLAYYTDQAVEDMVKNSILAGLDAVNQAEQSLG